MTATAAGRERGRGKRERSRNKRGKQTELMYYSNTYSISAKPQLVRTHNAAYEQCANSQVVYAFAVYAGLPFLLLLCIRPASAAASSSSCSPFPSRSCIQRFIGCYKYIIRDKYVPSSFQSVCRSGPLALLSFPSSFFLPLPLHILRCLPSHISKKWLAIKAFSALLHIC